MKHTDSRFWWEDLPQAREAYCRVREAGWSAIQGTSIIHLYERPEPDGLFLEYYALQLAIESRVSTAGFQRKYRKSIDELKGSKGGPQ